jgi:hypothetical protein
MVWQPVPSGLPSTKAVVADSRYAVLVWRSGGDGSPTEVRLPAGYRSTIVSDVSFTVQTRNLVLSGTGTAGATHFALIADSPAPSADALTAARTELAKWVAAAFPS